MDPQLYIGRCQEQVERFLAECEPLLADAPETDGSIQI